MSELVHVTGPIGALPDDPAVLDHMQEPEAFVSAALERARTWLQLVNTDDLADVRDFKVKASAVQEVVRQKVAQKEMAKDAELAASEIVRRCERRIGELIRQGQEEGTVRSRRTGRPKVGVDNPQISPRDIVPVHEWQGGGRQPGIADLTDGTTAQEFEEALAQARDEGNLSRANVARKCAERTGKAPKRPKQERHEVLRKTRHIDHERIVTETAHSLEGLVIGIELVEVDALDPAQADEWATSISNSLRLLNRFSKQLKEVARGHEG